MNEDILKQLNEGYVSRNEYAEMLKRLDESQDRQDHRLNRLEDNYEKLTDLTLSVRELSAGINAMRDEIERQGERLEQIEREPADNWRKFVWYVITAIAGAGLALIAKSFGM